VGCQESSQVPACGKSLRSHRVPRAAAHPAESSGATGAIEQRLGSLKRRDRDSSVWQPLLSPVFRLVAGGDCLDSAPERLSS